MISARNFVKNENFKNLKKAPLDITLRLLKNLESPSYLLSKKLENSERNPVRDPYRWFTQ